MGMNKACIGRTYPEIGYAVTKEGIQKYCLGINETSPFFWDESKDGGLIGPPLFGIVPSLPASAGPLFDPDLNANIMMLVHGEQDMTFHRLLKPGDELKTGAKILNIEDKGSGELITVESTTKDKSGAVVQVAKGGYFIRGGGKGGGGKKDEPAPEASNKKPLFTVVMEVAKDQSIRYAEGSGDRNPIHVDDNVAKMAGLPGIIIHGMCTLGLASKGIIDKQLDSDPRKVKRIAVRFAKIVLPKETLSTEAWIVEKNDKMTILGFETKNRAGDLVLKNGLVESAN
ncbi:MAG: MaoC family dehydratase N-terminal domain-containing protein [Nitrospirae bacterium]|nr:MaoC family dehydratase N-terminal domain-containing protein [Nitrospirota bacterium]